MARTLKTVLSIDVAKFKSGLNNAKASVKGFNTAIVKPLGDMIRKFVRLGVVVGAIGVAFAAFGARAAGEIQNARMRLAGISSSAEDFRQSWAATYRTFVTSPLELGETIGAFTTLKNAGVGNKKMLDSVAGASVALGRAVEDVALSFLSMETEPLRRMGVTARSVRKGLETAFTLEAVDKLGNRVVKTATNIKDARVALGELLDMKYGGTLDAFSRTWKGVWSTFRGIRQMAFFEMLKGSMQSLAPMVMYLNDRITKMADGGKLEEFGKKIARFAVRSVAHLYNFIQAIRNFSLKSWAADNMATIIHFGSVFAFVFGVKIVSAIGSMIQAIQLMPKAVGGVLGVISAMMIAWNIGKILENKFDISHYVLKFALGIKTMVGLLADMATGKGSEAMNARMEQYGSDVDTLNDLHEQTIKAASKSLQQPDWMKDAFEKFKPISEEELAGMMNAGASIGEAIEEGAKKAKNGWRDIFDERSRRGIGKIFGGGALGGGDEQKRTKAALAMVKKQGKTNELLQQVVFGFNTPNPATGMWF